MARTVNQEEYAAKQSEILDAAQRFVYSKGYERMTIQDIRGELGMSSGAFFHYFPSKAAVLEALIERMQEAAEAPLLPIVDDLQLSAVEKLRRYFDTLNQSRTEHKAFLADLARVWFADENAIVREKVNAAIDERRAPLLNAIVRQGVEEGSFATPYPDHAGEIILALARGMATTLTKLMIAFAQADDQERIVDQIVASYAAYAEAIERLLRAASGLLNCPDADEIREWLDGEV